jgi:hypothetical protein
MGRKQNAYRILVKKLQEPEYEEDIYLDAKVIYK